MGSEATLSRVAVVSAISGVFLDRRMDVVVERPRDDGRRSRISKSAKQPPETPLLPH
jgi:hypothetical protein